MTLPTTHLAYSDIYDVLDRALAAPNGIRVRMATQDEATFWRMRAHKARTISRERNSETYDRGHPMYGSSIYDKLVIRIRDTEDGVFVYITQLSIDNLEIEELADGHSLPPLLEAQEQLQIVQRPVLQIEHLKRRV